MFARGLKEDAVLSVIRTGEVIEEYLNDLPYPSVLLLGVVGDLPLHVVLGIDSVGEVCYVVTAYEPDPHWWKPDFRTRRRRELRNL
jgi:hypothetical protein